MNTAEIQRAEAARRRVGRAGQRSARQAVLWIGLYVALTALAMVLALLPPTPPARGFWIEFAVGLGFVGLAMLGLQFALTARFRQIAAPFGIDSMLHFHRQAGLVAFGFVLLHPLILFVVEPGYLEFLDPRVSFVRAAALWVLLGSLLLLIATTLWRQPLGLAYEWWRVAHGVLALLVVFVGLVHVLRVGYYISVPWKQALWVGMTGAAMLLLMHARVVKPLRMRRRPYRVTEVLRERGRAWTLVVEPDGHAGMSFLPGQFAWLTLGPSPFSLEQHPFSFASSAQHPERLEFTIKELGDFTSTIGTVRPGMRAWLEGPYGAFTLSPEATGAVFVVGGVGITPVMSMLRTLRDEGDRRPLLLIYGTSGWENIIFREELHTLESELELRVVHVIEKPPLEWEGEVGMIRQELLERYLAPERGDGIEYFVCGPEPMMDLAELYLVRKGIPLHKLNSERFNIA